MATRDGEPATAVPAVAVDDHAAGGVRGRLSHLAGSLSNRVLEEVDADAVVQRLDVEALLARVDLDALVGRVDLDALVGRIDVDALVGRIDVDALVGRIDVDAAIGRVDVDRLLDRVDVDRLLDRVNVDRLLARVGVDRLLDRADVDRLLDRVDVDRLLDRVDVDRLAARLDLDAVLDRIDLDIVLGRVDLEGAVRRAGLPELVADSTGQVAGSALDMARRQLVGLDVGLGRLVQRLLRRDPEALPPGPPGLVTDERARIAPPAPGRSRQKARFEVSGFYAGPLSRVLAFGGDVALATSSFTATAAVLAWLLSTLLGIETDDGDRSGLLGAALFVGWLFTYWWLSTALVGRTPVMMFAGLRIVSRDGTPLRGGNALVRTLTLPLSLLAFGLGGAWMLVDRERRALHDLLAGSTVVYDWGGRPAELPAPLTRWIADHADRA